MDRTNTRVQNVARYCGPVALAALLGSTPEVVTRVLLAERPVAMRGRRGGTSASDLERTAVAMGPWRFARRPLMLTERRKQPTVRQVAAQLGVGRYLLDVGPRSRGHWVALVHGELTCSMHGTAHVARHGARRKRVRAVFALERTSS